METRKVSLMALILISAVLSLSLAHVLASPILSLTTSANFGTVSPTSSFYNIGTQITITATPPDTDEYGRYVWLGWNGTGAGSYSGMNNPATITVNDSINETALWRHEYRVTLNRAILNKVTETTGNFTFAGQYWYEDGSQVSIQAPPPPSAANGERYVFDWWVPEYGVGAYQGPNATFQITIKSPMNETALWAHQYQIEIGATGVDSGHQEDTVTLGGAPYWNATTTLWPYKGEPLSFAFASQLTGWAGTWRDVWVSTSGLSTQRNGTIIISAPGTLTANYKTQYYLDVVSPHETSGGTGWYDSNATTYATLPQPIVSPSPGVRQVFTGWSGDGSGSKFTQSDPILMDRSRTVTADFTTQFQVAVGRSGVGSDFVGTVATVDGVAFSNGASFWWDNASSHTFSFPSQLEVSIGKMYVWSSTTGLSTQQTGTLTTSAPGLITGNYKTQYYLDVVSPGGASGGGGAGWYDSGATAYAALPQPIVNGSSGVRYVFTGWSGDASGTALSSNPITLNGSKSATALYTKQFLVVFNQTGLPNGVNVLVNSSSRPLPYSEWVDEGTNVQFAYQDQLSNGFGQQYVLASTSIPSPLTVESPITVTAYYTTQYTMGLYALLIVPTILVLAGGILLWRRRKKTRLEPLQDSPGRQPKSRYYSRNSQTHAIKG